MWWGHGKVKRPAALKGVRTVSEHTGDTMQQVPADSTSAESSPEKSDRYCCRNCGLQVCVNADQTRARTQSSNSLTSSASLDSLVSSSTAGTSQSGSSLPGSASDAAACEQECGSSCAGPQIPLGVEEWEIKTDNPDSPWGDMASPPHNRVKTMCSCGEWGCTCRCNLPPSGPSPGELRFFYTGVDVRRIAGIEDSSRNDPRFCSPECRWSFRAKQEFQISHQLASRKAQLIKAQKRQQQQAAEQLAAAELAAPHGETAETGFKLDRAAPGARLTTSGAGAFTP